MGMVNSFQLFQYINVYILDFAPREMYNAFKIYPHVRRVLLLIYLISYIDFIYFTF